MYLSKGWLDCLSHFNRKGANNSKNISTAFSRVSSSTRDWTPWMTVQHKGQLQQGTPESVWKPATGELSAVLSVTAGISVIAGISAIGGAPAATSTGCQGHLSISNSSEAVSNMGSRDANSRKIICNSRVDFSSRGMNTEHLWRQQQ